MRRAVHIDAERDGVRDGAGDGVDRRLVTLVTEFMTEAGGVHTLVTEPVTESTAVRSSL
jgi:hypothetical protein